MRRRSIVLALLLAAGLGGPPARAGDATGAFAPYEDLLEVLGDLTWHLRDDLYRFPPAKDPTTSRAIPTATVNAKPAIAASEALPRREASA